MMPQFKFTICGCTMLLFLFVISSISAQVEDEAVFQTIHPVDSSAHAAYIKHKAWHYIDMTAQGPVLVSQIEDIIKVYDDQGEDFANFEIPAYKDGSDKERLFGIKGKTYNNVNGKIVETKLSKKDIYKESTTKNFEIHKWAMPNVKAGSVIEISYEKRSPWFYTIPRFDFQFEIPVEYAECKVQVPTYLVYTPIPSGLLPLKTEKENTFGDSGKETIFAYSASNVEALKDDDYVLNIDDYRGSLKYEIHSIDLPGRVAENYSKSWDEISENMMEHSDFGRQIKQKTSDLKTFISTLKGKSDKEKIAEIYTHVQTEYAWNKKYGEYCEEGVKNLIKKKTGNVGDINILLINLLNQVDVVAFPLALKSRGRGLLNPYYPSVSELNYVVAYIPLGEDKFQLLDATSKYHPAGQLPTRAINMNGLLIKDKKGSIISIPNKNKASYNGIVKYTIDLEQPALIGGGKSLRRGYAATQYRMNLDNTDDQDEEDEADEEDEEEEEDVALDNESTTLSVKGLDNINENITVEFDETLYNEMAIIGDQIFINATLDFGMKENPFFEESRKMPIFYNHLRSTSYVATIKIPEGYEIESKPEPISMTLADRSIKFIYDIQTRADEMIIYYTFNINKDIFDSSIYPDLKEIYNRIIEMSKSKIVLSPM